MGITEAVGEPTDTLAARIDEVLAAHAGDARAAIETLLMFSDGISESISFGYVRGRLSAQARPGAHEEGNGHGKDDD